MNNLEKILSKHKMEKFEFSESFSENVMASIQSVGIASQRIVQLWEKRVWRAVAACAVAVLISVYALEGSLTFDAFLGLSEHSSSEVSQSIETYSEWDFE